jgi:hypothetical protein
MGLEQTIGMRHRFGYWLFVGCWSCSGLAPDGMPDGSLVAREAGRLDAGRDAGPAPDGRPADASDDRRMPPRVFTVPLTGCTAATYLASVEIGGSQTFELAIDTGSTTLGVAADACTSCGVSPRYRPGPKAIDEHRTVSSLYGDTTEAGATGWSGEAYDDAVGVGAAPDVLMKLAAIEAQRDFFHPLVCESAVLPYQGILGLAPREDAIPGTDGYFDRLVRTSSIADVFATLLCDPGGRLWLGGFDPAFTTAAPRYTPWSASAAAPRSYLVDLESISVGASTVHLPAPPYVDTILDTGNSAVFLPPAAFSMVATVVEGSAGFVAAFGADAGAPDAGGGFFSATGGCATTTFTKAELDSSLPPITLVFGATAPVSLTAVATESYLIPFRGGAWCSALYLLAPDASYPFVASLGAPMLRSSVVIFDRAQRRIGFAPHAPCP